MFNCSVIRPEHTEVNLTLTNYDVQLIEEAKIIISEIYKKQKDKIRQELLSDLLMNKMVPMNKIVHHDTDEIDTVQVELKLHLTVGLQQKTICLGNRLTI